MDALGFSRQNEWSKKQRPGLEDSLNYAHEEGVRLSFGDWID